MKSKQITLLIAFVVAAAAGLLAYNYLSAAGKATTVGSTRRVVIAAVDIPARVRITAAMLKIVDRPVDEVEHDAVNDPKTIEGFLALTTISAGSVLATSRVGKPDDAPLPVRLKPGMRALSIPIDSVRGVAGLIEPGDHVDIIAVLNKSTGESKVETFLHDVLVLAMGTSLEQSNNPQTTESPAATTVTVALTPKQAELLTLADSVATLRLALRPPGDKVNSSQDTFILPVQSTDAPQAAPPAPAPAPPAVVERTVQAAAVATPKSAPARQLMVTVIDGDQVVGSGK